MQQRTFAQLGFVEIVQVGEIAFVRGQLAIEHVGLSTSQGQQLADAPHIANDTVIHLLCGRALELGVVQQAVGWRSTDLHL